MAGGSCPSDDPLDVAPVLGALFEYYLTPRVSMGTGFGFADPSFSNGNLVLPGFPRRGRLRVAGPRVYGPFAQMS